MIVLNPTSPAGVVNGPMHQRNNWLLLRVSGFYGKALKTTPAEEVGLCLIFPQAEEHGNYWLFNEFRALGQRPENPPRRGGGACATVQMARMTAAAL